MIAIALCVGGPAPGAGESCIAMALKEHLLRHLIAVLQNRAAMLQDMVECVEEVRLLTGFILAPYNI